MARTDPPLNKTPRFFILASVCITVAALYFARDVLIPLALAILLSFLLTPLVRRFERMGTHRVAAVTIVMTIVITIVGVLTWAVALQVKDLADQIPRYKDNIVAKVKAVRGSSDSGTIGKAAQAYEEVKHAVTDTTTQPATTTASQASAPVTPTPRLPASATRPIDVHVVPDRSALDTLGEYLGLVIGPIGTAGIVLVFVIFMLVEREDLRDRIIRLLGEGRLHITTDAIDDAAKRISRYLMAQAIVNGTYGVAISLGLCLIGLFLGGEWFPSFVLWGLLCALLRFIPYIGPWIASAFPLAIAFAIYPGYLVFGAVVALFVIIELLSNNLMEPWLYGASTGMSTVAVLVAAVFWTWLWGPIGLLLATPMTVCIVVIGKYVPQFAFLDILLGDRPVLEPHQRLYQRLLAGDNEEATDLAEEFVENEPLEVVYDTMILPALAMAEDDRQAGRLDERRGMFIRQTLRDIVDELIDEERLKDVRQAADDTLRLARDGVETARVTTSTPTPAEPAAPATPAPPATPTRASIPKGCLINVVCLPAHDQADEIVGVMLAQLLELRGYCAFPVSHNALASEMLEEVERRGADVVCVSALPPAAVAHARYLCKRLHARFEEVHPVVGLWTMKGDIRKARHRIACSGDVNLATTLTQALDRITELAQPMVVRNANEKAEPAA